MTPTASAASSSWPITRLMREASWSNWPHAPGPEGLTPMSLVFHRSLRAQSEELYGMGGRRDEIGRLFDPEPRQQRTGKLRAARVGISLGPWATSLDRRPRRKAV